MSLTISVTVSLSFFTVINTLPFSTLYRIGIHARESVEKQNFQYLVVVKVFAAIQLGIHALPVPFVQDFYPVFQIVVKFILP